MKRRSVIIIGKDKAEVRIYTLRRREGYLSHQCSWHDLGSRQTRTYASLQEARTFAHQKSISLANDTPGGSPEVSLRELDLLRTCESRVTGFGLTVAAAIEEWVAAKSLLAGGPLVAAAQHYRHHHADLVPKVLDAAVAEFLEAKKTVVSPVHLRTLRIYTRKLQRFVGNPPIADIAPSQIEACLLSSAAHHRTRNNLRKSLINLFRWAQHQGYIAAERKTAPERTISFTGVDAAPAIYTPEELRKLLAVCRPEVLLHVAIGAFAGIRTAEIARLDWKDVLWGRGYIEIKAAKAKTRARRLVPLHENLRAWLAPHRKEEGPICSSKKLWRWLEQIGRKSGVPWQQNALRHSYASYRLAQVQDAPKVALELGNSPQMLFQHYRELVTPEAAVEWFSIMPGA